MIRTAILALLIGCTTPAKHTPDANPEQEKENTKFEGYLAGYAEAEQTTVERFPARVTYEAAKPTEPVKWEDPDLQVVCWRAPEGISCLPSHTVKAKARWK